MPPFLDDTDFKTAETGLTINNTDVKIVMNGGASADKNSGGGTHRANGVYGFTFDATDTATVGEMQVSIKVAGALPVFKTFVVLEEAVYDALFAASAPGYVSNAPVNVAQIAGASVSTSTAQIGVNVVNAGGVAWASGAITSSVLATDCIGSGQLAASAVTEFWAGVTDSPGVSTLLTRLSAARAGYLDNVNNSNLASVPAFPNNFPLLGINASGHLSRVTLADTATTLTNVGDVWDVTLSSHLTAGSTGSALNAAGSAGDPWATVLPGAYGAGTAGNILGNRLDAAVSSRATNAGVWSNGTRNLTGLGFTLGASDYGTDWLTSTGLAASAVSEFWAAAADSPGVTTLLSRVTGAVALASSVAALNNISSTDVLNQVNAALDTPLTLPGQANPTTTPTPRTALAQLFQQGVRPYQEDASQQRLYDATGTTVLQKRSVSDDGTTLTLGALVAGP